MANTFLWYDYETWGAEPACDRAAQFAGLRTDADLNPIGKPLTLYCRPADDLLPHPEACLITGITPQKARAEGVCEAEFFANIHAEMIRPGTCTLGYNSLRFDDEFTRYGLYRNLFDPYAREWRDGNSRWDLIDVVRLTHALRPEGIEWPEHEPGVPSFKLEHLTAANGIEHAGAHDAMADVYATIELARLVRRQQPKLFDYLLQHRTKQRAAELLNLRQPRPLLHVSAMYPARLGCIAPVVPVAAHPQNKNGVLVYDLRHDPGPLLDLPAEAVHRRLFTPAAELPAGEERIPLKTVHLNKCPVLAPLNTLTPEAAERWQIDPEQGQRHWRRLQQAGPQLQQKLAAVHEMGRFEPITDPDRNLYGGGFFSDADRERMQRIRATPPQGLAAIPQAFDDPRLPEMLFRYRARNWPATLSKGEAERWDAFRRWRLSDPQGGAGITLDAFRKVLAERMIDPALSPEQRAVLSELADWPDCIEL